MDKPPMERGLDAAADAAGGYIPPRIVKIVKAGVTAALASPAALNVSEPNNLYGPHGHLVIARGLGEEHWRLSDEPENDADHVSLPMFTKTDPFSHRPAALAPSTSAATRGEPAADLINSGQLGSIEPCQRCGGEGLAYNAMDERYEECPDCEERVPAMAPPAPAVESAQVKPEDLQLLMQLERDNRHDGARPVISRGPALDQAFRLSELGLLAMEQLAGGVRLHITRKAVATIRASLDLATDAEG